MSYPFNYPTPQNANVQIFNAASGPTTSTAAAEWVKPQGVSFVWFTLIGAGGGGGGTDGINAGGGGASGAMLHCLAPAFILPDILRVQVGQGGAGGVGSTSGSSGNNTAVTYNNKATYAFLLVGSGGGGSPGTGGTTTTASLATLSPAIFYTQVTGTTGTSTNTTPSNSTPLSGGGAGTVTANYGYTTTKAGTFQISPILVGTGGGSDTSGAYKGGVGCGGGGISNLAQTTTTAGAGGAGMAIIISW